MDVMISILDLINLEDCRDEHYWKQRVNFNKLFPYFSLRSHGIILDAINLRRLQRWTFSFMYVKKIITTLKAIFSSLDQAMYMLIERP